MTIRCQTVQVMGSGQSAATHQEYGDEPGIGQYYGETIDVILSIDPAFIDVADDVEQLNRSFDEIRPYKNPVIIHIHYHPVTVVDGQTLQLAMSDLAQQIEQKVTSPDSHKFMALIWTPFWKQGEAFATIQRIGKYIYSYMVMRNGLNPYPFGVSMTLKHEINHLLGLAGDNGFPSSNGDQVALANETASDYIYAGGMQPAWMASDELKAITHLKFDNGIEIGEKLFGCRDGRRIPWYHQYTNTTIPHREYSATWEEVSRQVDGINSGQTVNRNVC